ncbi:MAG: hypothetical protein FJ144_18615 [Deltaproteobacteria bacterium]|nr:hypothetical protein [Deltaproteobacteria bacterium]
MILAGLALLIASSGASHVSAEGRVPLRTARTARPGQLEAMIAQLRLEVAQLQGRVEAESRRLQGDAGGAVPGFSSGLCSDPCAVDSDEDGIGDCEDPCPCDASGADSDGDGALDCYDPCPDDATDACIDPCRNDSDGDGTNDCEDPCPYQADPAVDENDDGIPDCKDMCGIEVLPDGSVTPLPCVVLPAEPGTR